MNKKALIFDVDGTLANTEDDGHRPAFNAAFKDNGLDWNWDIELYHKLLKVAGGRERILHYINDYLPAEKRPDNADELAKAMHKAKTGFYVQYLEEGKIPLRPGIKRVILEAREKGLKMAIATTTSPENITGLIDGNLGKGAMSWFEVVGHGGNCPDKKPDPQVYHFVLKEMGLSASDCVAFEDSEIGLKAAGAAGIDTIITENDITRGHDFSGAVVVLSDMGEPGKPCRILESKFPDRKFEYFSIDTLKLLFG